MPSGRKKCDKCHGKGGSYEVVKVFGVEIERMIRCSQCKDKGYWWPNNKPKRVKP